MRDFFKYVLATIVGLIITGGIMLVLGIISLVGMVASTNKKADIKDNSVLVLNLSGMMEEREENNFIAKLTGQVTKNIGLEQLVSGLKKAKNNDKIKGVYIEAGAFASNSYASMQEAREALIDFKKSGKWIVTYSDTYTQGTYYLASVADEIYLNPQGQLDWHGLTSQHYYLKNLMEKFGVKMQVSKVGTYKSATETFTGDKMSDADREQTTAYLNGIWKHIVKGVSESRKISEAKLNQYADSMITLAAATDYVKMGLVDKLLYTDQVKMAVKKRMGIAEDEHLNQVTLADINANEEDDDEGEEIAVYYAVGDIVDGVAGGMMPSKSVIDAEVVCKDIEKLMHDDDVKAVVLRINSGGGSAYASEQMWHYIMELKKVKPVVVSMGGYAASGGYYISAPANWIVAEPTTITGSIGIFGMFPDFSGFYTEKLGVKFDEVNTNKNSGFGTMARPFNADELRMLQIYIDRGYNTFKSRVAQGRKLSMAQVEALAQGHVYTGEDAMKIKLVDELGGLDAAVKKAATLAKLKAYHAKNYPVPAEWIEQLFNENPAGSYLDEQMRATLGTLYEPVMLMKNIKNQSVIQARMPYFININ
ncbi:signal peptide peptidase SppA [Prevotella ihumii]|uniref:signal peptide peptidase SppA n=1 Tax=Prevotella ihumii TaxID=1917878 RepID=UPI000980B166|nr:signal peptide peptidase SppA [Prevotella ihumii]